MPDDVPHLREPAPSRRRFLVGGALLGTAGAALGANALLDSAAATAGAAASVSGVSPYSSTVLAFAPASSSASAIDRCPR